MKRMRMKMAWIFSSLPLVLLFAGCGESSTTALVRVSVNAQTASEISHVKIILSAPDISPPLVKNLMYDAGNWVGILNDIPLGEYRTFKAQAFDANYTPLLNGQSDRVSLYNENPLQVQITLNQLSKLPGERNEAPFITAVIAPPSIASMNSEFQLSVTAWDEEPEFLSYQWWTASGEGTFGDANNAHTTFRPAQSSRENDTIYIKVTDPLGLFHVTEIPIKISFEEAAVNPQDIYKSSINLWPHIELLHTVKCINQTSAADCRCDGYFDHSWVDVGQVLEMQVAVWDDSLAADYSWEWNKNNDCVGEFNTSSNYASFKPTNSASPGICSFSVKLTDNMGEFGMSHLVLPLGSPLEEIDQSRLPSKYEIWNWAKSKNLSQEFTPPSN